MYLPLQGLLYGSPGCGKTRFAKAIAQASGCQFIHLQASSLADKWYRESQKLTAAVFLLVTKIQLCIILIDKIGKQGAAAERLNDLSKATERQWQSWDLNPGIQAPRLRPQDHNASKPQGWKQRVPMPAGSNATVTAL
ncbi:unnamed protein product [Natator depressus]